jgi:hypothetical protein
MTAARLSTSWMPACMHEEMALPAIRARVTRVSMTPRLSQSWIRQPTTSTSFGFSL